jgi:hypothetical protein
MFKQWKGNNPNFLQEFYNTHNKLLDNNLQLNIHRLVEIK